MRMSSIVRHVRASDGIVGVLGNHDFGTMVPKVEEIGIRILLNDHTFLRRGDDEIALLGTQFTTEEADSLGPAQTTLAEATLQRDPQVVHAA